MHAQRGAPVQRQGAPVAVHGDERGGSADLPPVVEAEVAGDAREEDEVGLAQRLLSPVADLEGRGRPQETSGRSREEDREVQRSDGPCEARRVGGRHHRAAAENDDGPLAARQEQRCGPDAPGLRRRGRRWLGIARCRVARSREDRVEVTAEVPLRRGLDEPLRLAGLPAVPAADERLVVEEIHRALDEDRARDPFATDRKRPLERGDEVPHLRHRRRPLDDGPDEPELIDVLERTAPPEDGRRRTAEKNEGRLREAGVLERRDRVRHARSGRHGRHARHPREPGDGIGSEDGGRLVPRVDDADAARLRRGQDR